MRLGIYGTPEYGNCTWVRWVVSKTLPGTIVIPCTHFSGVGRIALDEARSRHLPTETPKSVRVDNPGTLLKHVERIIAFVTDLDEDILYFLERAARAHIPVLLYDNDGKVLDATAVLRAKSLVQGDLCRTKQQSQSQRTLRPARRPPSASPCISTNPSSLAMSAKGPTPVLRSKNYLRNA